MKITVYTVSDCPFSQKEKEYLRSHGLPFEEKNLETNREFLTEMLAVSNNFAGTPVTKIEKDDGSISVLKGFTQEEFDNVLGYAPVRAQQQDDQPQPPTPTPPSDQPPTPQPSQPPTGPTTPPSEPEPPPAPTPPSAPQGEPTPPPEPTAPPVSEPGTPTPAPQEPPKPEGPATPPQQGQQSDPLANILKELQNKSGDEQSQQPQNLPNLPNFPK